MYNRRDNGILCPRINRSGSYCFWSVHLSVCHKTLSLPLKCTFSSDSQDSCDLHFWPNDFKNWPEWCQSSKCVLRLTGLTHITDWNNTQSKIQSQNNYQCEAIFPFFFIGMGHLAAPNVVHYHVELMTSNMYTKFEKNTPSRTYLFHIFYFQWLII